MRGESARAKFSSFSEDIFTLVSVLLATVFPDDLASCLAYKRRLPLCCTYDGDGNVAKDEKKTKNKNTGTVRVMLLGHVVM